MKFTHVQGLRPHLLKRSALAVRHEASLIAVASLPFQKARAVSRNWSFLSARTGEQPPYGRRPDQWHQAWRRVDTEEHRILPAAVQKTATFVEPARLARKSVALQMSKRQCISRTAIEASKHLAEDRLFGDGGLEQGHARAQL